MSLPGDIASSTAVVSALLPPDTSSRLDRLVDYELGGVAVGDASQGMQVRQWRVSIVGSDVCIAPYPEGTPSTPLFDASNVTEVSLAFDQLMHPTVAFVQAGVTKLYWFDSFAAAQVTTSYPGASSPMVCLDDKRASQVVSGVTDVLFFYLIAGTVCYRQQRDRFLIERTLASSVHGATQITGVGMGTNGRVQVFLNATPPVHVDLSQGKLYVAQSDGTVHAMEEGSAANAVWRSKWFQIDEQASFGWARVEASAYPLQITVQADGLAKNITVVSVAPFRLPPMRGRVWQVEVRGAAQVHTVVMAGSLEELERTDVDDIQV